MPDTGTKTTYQDMTVHVNDLIVDGTALSTTELQYLDGVTAGTVTASKAVVVDASKNAQTFGTVDVTSLEIGGTAVSATAAEINAVADVSGTVVALAADDTTLVVAASDSGRIHTIPDLDATSDIALPAAAAGLNYRFIYAGVAADAHNFTLDATGFFIGAVTWHDTGATTFNIVNSDNTDDDVLTVTKAGSGTYIDVVCDGTNWLITGFVSSTDTPGFA